VLSCVGDRAGPRNSQRLLLNPRLNPGQRQCASIELSYAGVATMRGVVARENRQVRNAGVGQPGKAAGPQLRSSGPTWVADAFQGERNWKNRDIVLRIDLRCGGLGGAGLAA
jgi:hypothetical protein